MFKFYLSFLEGYIEDRINTLAQQWKDENPYQQMPYSLATLTKTFKDNRQQHKLDINQFKTFDDFVDMMKKIMGKEITTKKETKRQIRKGIPSLKEGIDYVEFYNLPKGIDEDIRVFAPLNHKASCAIGRESKWCTAMENDATYWNSYTQDGVVFFYILNPNDPYKEYRLWAVNVYKDGGRQYWDALDNDKGEYYAERIIGIKGEWFSANANKIRTKIAEVEAKKYKYSNLQEARKVFNSMINKTYDENDEIMYQGIINLNDNMEIVLKEDSASDLPTLIRFNKAINGKLPFKIKQADGDIIAKNIGLESCEGLPKIVKGNLKLENNRLTTLEGCPERVDGHFMVMENDLKNLKGAPRIIGKNFYAAYNSLESIDGMPTSVGGVVSFMMNDLDDVDLALIPNGKTMHIATPFPEDEDDTMKKKMQRFRPVKKNFKEGIKFFDTRHGKWYHLDPLFQEEDDEGEPGFWSSKH